VTKLEDLRMGLKPNNAHALDGGIAQLCCARATRLGENVMAFDPTLPVNNSLVSSAELRNQFNGI